MQSTTETRSAIEAAIIETPVTRMLAVVLIASIMLDMNVMIPTPAGVPDATRMRMVAPGSSTQQCDNRDDPPDDLSFVRHGKPPRFRGDRIQKHRQAADRPRVAKPR
jgi:hypothetical protein